MSKLFNTQVLAKQGKTTNSIEGNRDVAVIGMAGRIGGANNLEDFWRLLIASNNFISDLPTHRRDDIDRYLSFQGIDTSSYSFKQAAFLGSVDQFDFSFFNISHLEAQSMHPDQRVLLEVCWHAIEDAGYAGDRIRGTKTGTYLGYAREENRYLEMLQRLDPLNSAMSLTGNVASVAAGRIAYFLNLKGPSMLINTACSSSLVAVHQACRAIRSNDCEMAIVAGCNLLLTPFSRQGEVGGGLGVESSNGVTRSFDDRSDGTGGGEGCVVLVLKPLDKAIQDHDRVHAVIKGSAINQDGSSLNIAAPNLSAQRDVIVDAWKDAKIDPSLISFIEAHGTGTALGDPIEIAGLTAAFRNYTDKIQFCGVGSVKSNIGHLDAAAGIAGMAKAILSLRNAVIPPTLHFDKPNRNIEFEESPLFVNTRLTKLPERALCGVSAFGLSGTNAHVVLESASVAGASEPTEGIRIFTLSAANEAVMRELVAGYLEYLPLVNESIDDICYTACVGRAHLAYRISCVVTSKQDLLSRLETWSLGVKDSVYEGHQVKLKGVTRSNEEKVTSLVSRLRGTPLTRESLDSLALLYAEGASIPWVECFYLFQQNSAVVSLPLYPFQRKRCWPEIPEATPKNVMEEKPKLNRVNDEVKFPETITGDVFEAFRTYFSESFDLPASAITHETSMYEIGLDSISIVQVKQLIKRKYNVDVPVIDLFKKFSRIGELSRYIESKLVRDKPILGSTEPIAPTGNHLFDELVSIRQRIDALIPGSHSESLPVRKSVNYTPRTEHLAKAVHGLSATIESEVTARQLEYIERFCDDFNRRTARSLAHTLEYMPVFANNRNVSGFKKIFKRLQYTIIAERSEGTRVWDLDGNEYIDFAMGFGVFFLGHNHPVVRKAVEQQLSDGAWLGPLSTLPGKVAKLITELTGTERVAFYNSGTEAIMVAIRLARAATGRNKIVIFSGSYHGMSDGLLVQRNPYVSYYESVPLASGIPPAMGEDVYILEYDDPAALEFIEEHAEEIGAVLVEPVQSRRPQLQPFDFLHRLRDLTSQHSICLIFDEIITGFRIKAGGAQEFFGVTADLVAYGKVAGGGLPLGIVAGKSEFLMGIDGGIWEPSGNTLPKFDHRRTLVAGTFCHHPLAMSSAMAMLLYLKEQGDALYERMNHLTIRFADSINAYFEVENVPIRVYTCGSMFRFDSPIDLKFFFYHILHKGIYVWEGATFFISAVHTEEDIQVFSKAIRETVLEMRLSGFLPKDESARRNRVPLTEEQLRILVKTSEGPQASAALNEVISFPLEGPFNEKALEQSLSILLARHDALRVGMINSEGQLILEKVVPSIAKFKIVNGKAEEQQKQAVDLLAHEVARPFNIANGLLLRSCLIQYNNDHFLFGLVIHQIVADGFSLSLIREELRQLYTSLSTGRNPALQKASSFLDYITAIGERNGNEEALRNFWLYEWKAPINTSFDLDPFRPTMTGTRAYINFALPDGLYNAIKAYARKNASTTFTVLLSAFVKLIAKMTKFSEVVVGIPSVGQLLLDNPVLVGQCMQMIPFRYNVSAGALFEEMLSGVKDKLNDAQVYRNFSFGDILSYAATNGIDCYPPEVRVVFNLDPPVKDESIKPTMEPVYGESGFAKYDLFMNLVEVNGRLHVSLQYNSATFERVQMEQWIAAYRELLTFAVGLQVESPRLISYSPTGVKSVVEQLEFTFAANVWLLPGTLTVDEEEEWVVNVCERKGRLVVSESYPSDFPSQGAWIICGTREALLKVRASFILNNPPARWIIVTDEPISTSYFQRIPLLTNKVSVDVLFKPRGLDKCVFHYHEDLILISQVRILPVGIVLAGFSARCVDAQNDENPPNVVGQLQIRRHNEKEWKNAGYMVSVSPNGRFTIWSFANPSILLDKFPLEAKIINDVVMLHPEVTASEIETTGKNMVNAFVVVKYRSGTSNGINLKSFLKLFLPKSLIPNVAESYNDAAVQENGRLRPSAVSSDVLKIIRKVLHDTTINLDDNFYEVGGSSIQAVHLSTMLMKEIGISISPDRLLAMSSLSGIIESMYGEQRPPIPVTEARSSYPLSFAQRRFWIVEQMEEKFHTSVLFQVREIFGKLDQLKLRGAFERVIERHESLRTVFVVENDQPMQQILNSDSATLDYQYLENAQVATVIDDAVMKPFNLDRDRLVRVRLIRTSDDVHMLVIAVHHIVFDGWSFDVFMRDLIHAYGRVVNGVDAPLSRPALQLRDYCCWHNQQVLNDSQAHRDFWREFLLPMASPCSLNDKPRPAIKNYEASKLGLITTQTTAKAFANMARSQHVSMFMTIQSSLLALLYCHSGQDDLIIGTPVADRADEDLHDVIGCLINTLVIRTKFDPNESFLALLQRVRKSSTEAFAHQYYPFDMVVNDIKYERQLSRNPLFDVGFTYDEVAYIDDVPGTDDLGLRSRVIEPTSFTVKTDFWVHCIHGDHGIGFTILYDNQLFTEAFFRKVVSTFEFVLDTVARSPFITLKELASRAKVMHQIAEQRKYLDGSDELRKTLVSKSGRSNALR